MSTLSTEPTVTAYHDLPEDSARAERTADGYVWPCPRCAVTLAANRRDPARHDCPEWRAPTPSAVRRTHAARAKQIAAWWEGFDAAKATVVACDREHIDYGASIPIRENDPPRLILTSGGARPTVLMFSDQIAPDAAPSVLTGLAPVERAVMRARLLGFADLLDQTTPEACAASTAPRP